VLFGLLPAVRAIRVQQLTPHRRTRLHYALLAGEIAVALPLIVGAGLLVRSFVRMVTLDPGYDATNALSFQVATRGDRYSPVQVTRFAADLAARLAALPDVVAAGYARQLPMVRLQETHSFRRRPEPPPPGPAPDGADARYVSAGYVEAIGARLVAGRWPAAANEVLVNRTLARREFGTENPVGGIVYIGRNPIPRTIAGVVDDARLYQLDRDPPAQFFADLTLWDGPARFVFPVGPYFAVRTRQSPQAVVSTIAAAVRQIDPDAPLYNVATLDRILSNEVTLPRLYAVLVGVFASLAIVLAAVGVYGVVTYAVVQRTREIGIRMALGAQRRQVLQLMLRRTVAHAAAGIAIGLVAAAMLTRYLQALLFGVPPLDPMTFAGAAVMFALVAIVAAYIPARQATAVDPLVALRTE
jgi:putative ABC transport system permease protein